MLKFNILPCLKVMRQERFVQVPSGNIRSWQSNHVKGKYCKMCCQTGSVLLFANSTVKQMWSESDTGSREAKLTSWFVAPVTHTISPETMNYCRCCCCFLWCVVTDLWPAASRLGSVVNLLDRLLPGVRIRPGHQHRLETAQNPCGG